MDNLVFEESINTEISSSEFVDKQWLYVNDNNNSSYSGQIVIDTTSLSNCGSYINWSEAFLTIPCVLQVAAAGALLTAALQADFLMGLKSGYWQLLHSLTVEFNNGSVIQQTPFLNVFNSFKALTSWSAGDLQDWGAITGFYPDTATSWMYNNFGEVAANLSTMAPGGTGLTNNRNAPYVSITSLIGAWVVIAADVALVSGTNANVVSYNTTTQATAQSNSIKQSYNKGFYQRQVWLNYSAITNTGGALTQVSLNQVGLASGLAAPLVGGYNAIFQSYVQQAAAYRVIVFDAVIRLKDIADFFQKVPMLKGSTMRFYINTNQTYFTCKTQTATQILVAPVANATGATYGNQQTAGALFLTSQPIILGGGGTCPIMVASSDLGQGMNPLGPMVAVANDAASADIQFALSIVKTQFSQILPSITAPITSCRLYAPAYTMNPIAEQRYLSLAPTKKVVYNDIFYYTFNSIAPASPFSFLVTNGIPNVRGILVVPMVAKVSNGVIAGAPLIAGAITTSTLLSPFSTTGGTPDPISLTNFNIQVSGKNLFINNELYDYEQFSQQLVSSNQLNGSLTTSLASGLIGMSEFESLYRYYYGNVSRSIPSEDGVAKAIQLVGTNNSSATVDMMVFVEFERTVTIDVRTGARIA